MEKFSYFQYRILSDPLQRGWYYEIYSQDGQSLLEASQEVFATKGTARYAAIGHIHKLELLSSPQHGRF